MIFGFACICICPFMHAGKIVAALDLRHGFGKNAYSFVWHYIGKCWRTPRNEGNSIDIRSLLHTALLRHNNVTTTVSVCLQRIFMWHIFHRHKQLGICICPSIAALNPMHTACNCKNIRYKFEFILHSSIFISWLLSDNFPIVKCASNW